MPTTILNTLNLTAVLDEAFAAAEAKASEWLEKYGDRDCCGFAWVTIKPARGPLVNALKAHPKARVHKNYGAGGGIQLWNPSGNPTQSMTPKEDGASAFVEVLRKHGITKETSGMEIWTGSRMD